MINRFSCTCYAIEAAPQTFKTIPCVPNLHRYNFALCDINKTVRMSVDQDTTRSSIKRPPNGNAVTVQGRSFAEFLAHELPDRPIDIVKMDIEGAEIEVIESLDDEIIQKVGQWTIEFHDFNGLVKKEDVDRCVERVLDLGFRELFWSRRRNTADVLLVNKNILSVHRHIMEQHFVRLARAGLRATKKVARGQYRNRKR